MIRIKICGLTEPAGFDAAVAARADWIGFNFFPPSPRFVTPAQAAALAARAPGAATWVGLFVNPTDAEIDAVLAGMKLDILQLYCPAPRARDIRARANLPVWRAVGVETPSDLPASADGADALLIEAKPPQGATRPGGNATRFDWTITQDWRPPTPWLLAGGLDPTNVAEAIHASGTTAVDVSSGVERAKGIKDPTLVAAFAEAARTARPNGRR